LMRRVPGLRIVHQTGERDFEETRVAYEKSGVEAEVSPFIADMPAAFARADILLCRSGASTVAEVAAAGKPAIFVPFPFATDDHQKRNAQALATKGAALLIPESELTTERLTNEVSSMISGERRLAEMSAAARALSHPQAAEEIAAIAAELVERKGKN
jgi:UDP-N-acetylglucosamine--N-acetylmuramyl-(pentapeptide) pyrophosphoryl-undecaprenol N-acetylglucosamine transferase